MSCSYRLHVYTVLAALAFAMIGIILGAPMVSEIGLMIVLAVPGISAAYMALRSRVLGISQRILLILAMTVIYTYAIYALPTKP